MVEKMFAMEIALEVAPLHGIDIIADWQKNNAGARIATDRYRAGSLESCMPERCLLTPANFLRSGPSKLKVRYREKRKPAVQR